jgi:hypothetical protein
MHVEVAGWVGEAADDAERGRLSELADSYRDLAILSAARQANATRERLPQLLRAIASDGSAANQEALSPSEEEQLRQLFAVPPVSQISQLTFDQMNDLADLFEGWALSESIRQDHRARCLGYADGMRELAEAAGPNWNPRWKGEPGLALFLARQMNRARA